MTFLVALLITLGGLTPGEIKTPVNGGPVASSGIAETISPESIRAGFPIVLPPLPCDDTPDEYVNALFALGFRAQGIADSFGEALGDPTGRVIVRFAC